MAGGAGAGEVVEDYNLLYVALVKPAITQSNLRYSDLRKEKAISTRRQYQSLSSICCCILSSHHVVMCYSVHTDFVIKAPVSCLRTISIQIPSTDRKALVQRFIPISSPDLVHHFAIRPSG